MLCCKQQVHSDLYLHVLRNKYATLILEKLSCPIKMFSARDSGYSGRFVSHCS